MSIANELSCDVATAVLTRQRDDPASAPLRNKLTDIVLELHSTLHQLTNEARRRHSASFQASPQVRSQSGDDNNAASGSQ